MGSRTGYSSEVSDTFNRRYGSIQINASRSKCTDITGHLCKIIDGHIGIMIQFIQSLIYLLQSCPFGRCIRKNSLNSVDLCFILLKTGFNRVNRKSRNNIFTCGERGIGYVLESRNCHYLHRGEFYPYCLNRITKGVHVAFTGSRIYIFQAFRSASQIQFLF